MAEIRTTVILLLLLTVSLFGQDSPHKPMDYPCAECHGTGGWSTVSFDHAKTGYILDGQHRTVTCEGCHDIRDFALTDRDCASCHTDVHTATLGPDCIRCHSTQTWNVVDIFQVHQETEMVNLGRSHLRLDCAACHTSGKPEEYRFVTMECAGCHGSELLATTNPSHVAAGFTHECMDCHTLHAWQPSTFDHASVGFALSGVHSRLDCIECHTNEVYQAGQSLCYDCHRVEYEQTTDPNHVASGFSTDCQLCHSSFAWTPATFDHNATAFPLTGAHKTTDCIDCHTNNTYTGTPRECVACHLAEYNATSDPNHVSSGFPTDCEQCHSTTAWEPASFDHNATAFPLTGAHTSAACADCHQNNQYSGTPVDCIACHESEYNSANDPDHQSAQFPVTCENCHSTSAWKPANWDHDALYFPIYSGKHRGEWDNCVDCHLNTADYSQFECIYCHEHSQTRMNSEHNGVPNYSYNSAACYDCHPTGRE